MAAVSLELIFRILLIKLAAECTFKFNSRFFKQVDVCTMEEPLCVTFSENCIVKMESDVVILSKLVFCQRFVDGIYSRQKLGDKDLTN